MDEVHPWHPWLPWRGQGIKIHVRGFQLIVWHCRVFMIARKTPLCRLNFIDITRTSSRQRRVAERSQARSVGQVENTEATKTESPIPIVWLLIFMACDLQAQAQGQAQFRINAHAVDQYFNTIGGTYRPRVIIYLYPASWILNPVSWILAGYPESNYVFIIKAPVDYPPQG